jgi:hypothetical protein
MSFATTDERVHALRVSFAHVMHRIPEGAERVLQLKSLVAANHLLPKNAEQEKLEDDLLAALSQELHRDKPVSA